MAVDADLASLPLPDVPDKDIVAVYAKLVGELLYICINTVPEIMYALSALTRYMTRATSQHYGYDKQVLRYLKGVKHLKLTCCARSVKAPVSAWSALRFRRYKLGRRQVFAPQHAMLCVVLQRHSFLMEISSCSYPRSLDK